MDSTPVEDDLILCCKVECLVLYDTAVPLPGICPREITCTHAIRRLIQDCLQQRCSQEQKTESNPNVHKQKNGLVKWNVFRQWWKQINHNLLWKGNCGRGYFSEMATILVLAPNVLPEPSPPSPPPPIKRWSLFSPFEFGWVFVTASTHTRQKLCDFWGLVINRQCSFLLAFGALSCSVKSLMTLQPPSWRDPMERMHREGDRGSPRSWACVTSPGSRNVSEDVSEMTLALEIIWLQTHKRLWARNMLLSNSWIQR